MPPRGKRLKRRRVVGAVLALVLIFSQAGSSVGFAQYEGAFVRQVRAIETGELGMPNPAGLVFSPTAQAFHVVAARRPAQAPPPETDIVQITPFEQQAGSARIAAAIWDPVNMVFDSYASRLLILQPAARILIQISERAGGNLDPASLVRHDARAFGLWNPQGMAVDPANGHLFVLDAAGPRIVRIEPDRSGAFDGAVISEIDLGGIGLGNVQGLAFDPTSGHLHLLDRTDRQLYEVTQAGQVVAARDLSGFGLVEPQGLVFAPSADLTDDPLTMHLYIADSGLVGGQPQGMESVSAESEVQGTPGTIMELAFDEMPVAEAASFVCDLVQTIDTSAFDPPSPDTAGITYIDPRDHLLFSDSEVNEMPIYEGANLFEMTLGGNLVATGTSTSFSREPTGVAYNPANGHLFTSDDDGKEIYEIVAGDDGLYGTGDDTVTSFDTLAFNSGDPEGITFDRWQGVLFIVDGVNAEVYRVSPGANGLFDGVPPAGDDQVTSFDTSIHGINDPEGITFNSYNGNLYVVGRPAGTLAEFTTSGALVQTLDISAANAVKPAGLAYAPGSLDPDTRNIYIAARGVDNNTNPKENDGKVYELTLPPMTNAAPLANDDTAGTVIDTAVIINVAANDTDPDGNLDPATANTACSHGSSGCTGAAHGLLTDNGDGTITYDPDPGFSGDDSFVYEICDTEDLCDTATVSITVTAVNDAPVATDDAYSTAEDTVLEVAAPGVLGNDSDADEDPLTASLVDDVSHGTLALNADGSFSYTPQANYSGPDSFTYQANDGVADSDPATVNLTVNPVNDAPVADDDAYSTAEDTLLSVSAPGVLGNDNDVDGDTLTASLVDDVSHGSLTLNDDGSFSYTPQANYSGPDSFTYQVSDGPADSNLATVDLTVTPVNDAPVAAGNAYSTAEDTVLSVSAPGVLSNDSDVDGDPLTASLVDDVSSGLLVLNADGSFSYNPDPGFVGSDSFTYQADDSILTSNVATVNLTVNAVNDAPVAADDAYSTAEDTVLEVSAPGVLGNDSDVDEDPLTATLVSDVSHGTLTLNDDGSFSYMPQANYSGPDSFTYDASDGSLDSNVATASLTVTPVNDAPVAADDAYSTAEDTLLSMPAPGVLGNDGDVDGDTLTASLVDDVSHGTLTLNANGSFSYAPDPNYGGPDSFTYDASDGSLDSNVVTVRLTVTPVNDAPVAGDDAYSTAEDTLLSASAPGILGNDSDVEGDPLTASLVSDVSHGSLTLNDDGSFSYMPQANYSGPDSFTYQASDGPADSNLATVDLTVTPVNDAPVATDNAYSTAEDTLLSVSAPGVMGNDGDADGDPLTASLVSDVSNGSLTLNANGSFSYTPEADYSGPDSFTYQASDGSLDSNVATVRLTVTPVNDAPVAGDNAYSTAEDTPLSVSAPGVLGNDSDPDEDPLSASLVDDVSHGSLTLNDDGSFSYTPQANYSGPDSFTYQASDGSLDSNVATVRLTVTPVNDAPVAADDAYSTAEDTLLEVDAPGVLGNDSDAEGDPLTASLVDDVSHGSLVLDADGSFSYTPEADYSGPDSFTYDASDGSLDSNVATVSLTVTPVNDAPVAADDAYSTAEDTLLSVSAPGVLGNDSDVEGDPLSASLVSDVSHGSLTLNDDGSFSYTPEADYSGPDSFTYQASDGPADSNLATVDLTVTPVNDAPVAADDAYSTAEDTPLSVAAPGVLGNDDDAEGDPLTASLVDDVSHGSLALNDDGSFSYMPQADYSGPDSFSYNASDGPADSNLATVSLTVTPVNDAPLVTISAPTEGASYEAGETITFTASATDAEDGDVTASLAWVSSLEGSIGSGASFSRSDLSAGTHTITATATDSGELTGADEVTITVNPANNPPNTPGNPSPPEGATGVSIEAHLSWTGGDPDPGQSVTYDVYLAAGDPTPDALICEDTPTPACDPSTLTNGMHYYWYVVATDSHSASTTSPTWDFTTICPLPGTPVLGAPADGSTTEDTIPHFGWSPVSTATSYRIQVDDNSDFSSPELDATTSASDYVPTFPLSLGTQYWHVQAVNQCGTSAWSQSSTLKIVTRIYLPIMLRNVSNR